MTCPGKYAYVFGDIAHDDEFNLLDSRSRKNTLPSGSDPSPSAPIPTSAPGTQLLYASDDEEGFQPSDAHRVMEFVNMWVNSADGFSKTRTRPKGMKENITARIPPLPGFPTPIPHNP
jgi:predicted metal-binding protein